MLPLLLIIFLIDTNNQSVNAQFDWIMEVDTCATGECDVRLTQIKAFYISWVLNVRCVGANGYERYSYSGGGVYPGTLCNGAM
tara:strand:+ start:27826 stop:28074 length:249 start_codon:yes stop_codon:yes gene_type:complete